MLKRWGWLGGWVVGTWALVGLTYAQGQELSRNLSQTKVRVRMMSVNFPFEIEGDQVSIRGLEKEAIRDVALSHEEKIQIDLVRIKNHRIWVVKKGNRSVRLSEEFLKIEGQGLIKIGVRELSLPLLLAPKARGSCDVIAALDLEKYLQGVLAGEMPASWPLEALKTQAIAARSYTLFQMKVRENKPYHLDSGILDQAYSPSGIPPQQMERIRQAVVETDGMVLVQNNRIIKAYYHSDCGGQTEEPEKIWGPREARGLASVIDGHCAYNPQSRWSFEISKSELAEKIPEFHSRLTILQDLQIVSRTPSERVALLALNDGAHKMTISGTEFRRVLGYDRLKSTLFSVTQKDGIFRFSGRGYGHGGGLCQRGARFMAEAGAHVSEILRHYYPKARLSEIHVANN